MKLILKYFVIFTSDRSSIPAMLHVTQVCGVVGATFSCNMRVGVHSWVHFRFVCLVKDNIILELYQGAQYH